MKGDLKTDPTNGFDHLPLVPHVGENLADPRLRNELLLLDFEGESLASTGPLPHGPSVHFSSRSCADASNQPTGLEFLSALVRAAVLVHEEARCSLA